MTQCRIYDGPASAIDVIFTRELISPKNITTAISKDRNTQQMHTMFHGKGTCFALIIKELTYVL